MMNKKIELLAPAGDLESLELALYYGADAIYAGGKVGSLRADSSAFSNEDLKKAITLCHDVNKNFYLALNMIPHNEDLIFIENFLEEIRDYEIDAFIVSDFGVQKVVKKIFANPVFHLSTQANITNYESALFYKEQGFERIVLARELSIAEIEEFTKKTNLEYEIFAHGAMCLSYSGRCYLSSYLISRDGNRGECAQPCRWKYSLVENKSGEILPTFEDENGTYIMNSKDLCLLPFLPEIINLGISSIKIEGRMKSAYYIASVVRAYKNALLEQESAGKINNEHWLNELKKTSHRDFTSGFFYDADANDDANANDGANANANANANDGAGGTSRSLQKTESSTYTNNYDFIAKVLDYDDEENLALLLSRNKFSIGDVIEVFGKKDFKEMKIEKIFDEDKTPIEFSNTPMRKIYMALPFSVEKNMLIRRKKI